MPDVQHLMERRKVKLQVESCTNCELVKGCKQPVPFDGPSPNKIMVIGEAPGESEDSEGRPFTGPAGRLLRGYLRHNGLGPTLANAVSCFPYRTPTGREIKACADNLRSQVELVDPRFILLVGGTALSAIWPGQRVTEVRGNWFRLDNRYYYTTWHPSAVLRNSDLEPEFRTDIELFSDVAQLGVDLWKNNWCVKCNQAATTWVSPEADHLWGVPYCEKCYGYKTGTAGTGRTRATKARKAKREQPIADTLDWR